VGNAARIHQSRELCPARSARLGALCADRIGEFAKHGETIDRDAAAADSGGCTLRDSVRCSLCRLRAGRGMLLPFAHCNRSDSARLRGFQGGKGPLPHRILHRSANRSGIGTNNKFRLAAD
jgi:hypothetical protein